ncbi:MAG TPA: HAD-IA family hydrolase [Acidimicrobiia bacterium]|jgi:HAD superfamily hydrolase (TIGR01509 family)
MVAALVFDFDGLIVDTEWSLFNAWKRVFADYGAELTIADFSLAIGTRGGVDWGELLEAKTGRSGPSEAELRELKNPVEESLRSELMLLPGVVRLLDEATTRNVQCAIASSSGADWVQPFLAELEIEHHFATVSTWDGPHVGFGPKPEPGVYRAVCDRLGVNPSGCVAFEDSPHGITSAKAAGLACICVPNRLTVDLDLTHADVVLDSLLDVTWVDLEQLVAART